MQAGCHDGGRRGRWGRWGAGADGVARATRFNGFGEVETETVSDFPWASVYDRPVADVAMGHDDESDRVVSFPRLNRRRRNRIMKRR